MIRGDAFILYIAAPRSAEFLLKCILIRVGKAEVLYIPAPWLFPTDVSSIRATPEPFAFPSVISNPSISAAVLRFFVTTT